MESLKETLRNHPKIYCRIKRCQYREIFKELKDVNGNIVQKIPGDLVRMTCEFCSSGVCKLNETFN